MCRVLSRNFCLGGSISPQVNTITTTVQSQEYTGGKLEVLGEAEEFGGKLPPCPPLDRTLCVGVLLRTVIANFTIFLQVRVSGMWTQACNHP